MKTFKLFDRHTLAVIKCENPPEYIDPKKYRGVYAVHSFNESGVLRFYVGTGYQQEGQAPSKEVHVWYANGRGWYSFGKSIEDAVTKAAQDAWKYTEPRD